MLLCRIQVASSEHTNSRRFDEHILMTVRSHTHAHIHPQMHPRAQVEQFVYCDPDLSGPEMELMLQNAKVSVYVCSTVSFLVW